MADVDGTYNCTVKSPLGDQNLTLMVKVDGNTFAGQASGAMGAADVNGEVDGNTLKWKQQMTSPMPMTLDITATVNGDSVSGNVGAGAFGSFPLTGTRTA